MGENLSKHERGLQVFKPWKSKIQVFLGDHKGREEVRRPALSSFIKKINIQWNSQQKKIIILFL